MHGQLAVDAQRVTGRRGRVGGIGHPDERLEQVELERSVVAHPVAASLVPQLACGVAHPGAVCRWTRTPPAPRAARHRPGTRPPGPRRPRRVRRDRGARWRSGPPTPGSRTRSGPGRRGAPHSGRCRPPPRPSAWAPSDARRTSARRIRSRAPEQAVAVAHQPGRDRHRVPGDGLGRVAARAWSVGRRGSGSRRAADGARGQVSASSCSSYRQSELPGDHRQLVGRDPDTRQRRNSNTDDDRRTEHQEGAVDARLRVHECQLTRREVGALLHLQVHAQGSVAVDELGARGARSTRPAPSGRSRAPRSPGRTPRTRSGPPSRGRGATPGAAAGCTGRRSSRSARR